MVQTDSDQFQLVQNGLNHFWLVQIPSIQLKPVQTSSSQFQLVVTSSDWFKPVQTCSDQFWEVPASSELVWTGWNHSVPVWIGWNQFELVGTRRNWLELVFYPFYPVATSQQWSEPAWTNQNQPHHYPQEGDEENPPGNHFQTYKGQDDFEAPTLKCVGGITLSHPQCRQVRGEQFVLGPHLAKVRGPHLFVHLHHKQIRYWLDKCGLETWGTVWPSKELCCRLVTGCAPRGWYQVQVQHTMNIDKSKGKVLHLGRNNPRGAF